MIFNPIHRVIDYFTIKEVAVKPEISQHRDNHLTVKEKMKMIKDYFYNHDIVCRDINSKTVILTIYDACFHNIFIDSNREPICTHYGFCYLINKDYENMKMYWLRGIAQNSYDCLYNLAMYYYLETDDQDNIIKYLSLSSAMGNALSMTVLSLFYSKIGNQENALVYFLLSFNELLPKKEDYELKDWTKKFLDFGHFFNDERYVQQIVDLLHKLIKNNIFNNDIIKIIKTINIKYFDESNLLLLSYKKMLDSRIELIDLHFNYAPTSHGCAEAKEDFLDRL